MICKFQNGYDDQSAGPEHAECKGNSAGRVQEESGIDAGQSEAGQTRGQCQQQEEEYCRCEFSLEN